MRIGIIGAGSMGAGIAQVAASADCHVKIYDQSKEVCEKALIKLDKILKRLIEKGKIDDIKKQSIQDNISIISDIEDLKDSDLIIEAIIEDEKIKKNIFSNLSNLVSGECVIATNTSSLSITSLASSCNIP